MEAMLHRSRALSVCALSLWPLRRRGASYSAGKGAQQCVLHKWRGNSITKLWRGPKSPPCAHFTPKSILVALTSVTVSFVLQTRRPTLETSGGGLGTQKRD